MSTNNDHDSSSSLSSNSVEKNESAQGTTPGAPRPARRSEPVFLVAPTVIQKIKRVKGVMNHSYRDFSRVPPPEGYAAPSNIDDMNFAEKLHCILSLKEHQSCITWLPHGRAFKVTKPPEFEKFVCPTHFGHQRYSSFLRALNNHSFKHISKGVDRNSYYHEFMLKGRFYLCQYMPRRKDARRLVADPDNEPDLYLITERFPLEVIPAPSPAAVGQSIVPNVAVSTDSSETSSPAPMSTLSAVASSAPSHSESILTTLLQQYQQTSPVPVTLSPQPLQQHDTSLASLLQQFQQQASPVMGSPLNPQLPMLATLIQQQPPSPLPTPSLQTEDILKLLVQSFQQNQEQQQQQQQPTYMSVVPSVGQQKQQKQSVLSAQNLGLLQLLALVLTISAPQVAAASQPVPPAPTPVQAPSCAQPAPSVASSPQPPVGNPDVANATIALLTELLRQQHST